MQLKELVDHDVIVVVAERQDSRNRCNIYETREEVVEYLQQTEVVDKDDRLLPCSDPECPSTGFTNPRDVDGLKCKDCDEVHKRSEISDDD